MDKRFLLILQLIVLAWTTACNSADDEFVEQDFGYDYFPLEIGNYREYRVLEVNFLAAGPDTSRFLLREEITDSIVSGDQIVYTLERSVRPDAMAEWTLDSIWTARVTAREAVQVENNIPLVKIQFPVEEGRTWDGNAFNTMGEFRYESQLVSSDTLSDVVLRVIINDIPENIVLKDERSEYYARGIGLIYRDFETLNFCTVDCSNNPDIISGRVLNQQLTGFGSVSEPN